MILNQKELGSLSNLLLDFEVVYRSVVVQRIYDTYSDYTSFERKVNEIKALYQTPPTTVTPLNYLKLKNKILTYNSQKTRSVFEVIEKTVECTNQKRMVYEEQDILMVSELIDLVIFFFNPLFLDIGTKFGGGDILEQELNNFKKVRNASSHRGSRIISHQEATQAINFIVKNIMFIEPNHFWYVTKKDLEVESMKFLQNLKSDNVIKHNLYQVNKKHSSLLEREKEYGILKERILGKLGSVRKSGTVLIQGSGGVGKTALVLELCYEILSNEQELKFDFMMFLTSKEEELAFNSVTGDMRLDKLTPKYSNLEDIKITLLNLLQNGNKEVTLEEVLKDYSGIIVLDNFETISNEEQEKISDFITECPENIQFILTSRPTDKILENYILGVPINLMGLNEFQSQKFILDHLKEYDYDIEITNDNIKEFAKESCGNPLIMVMGLQRVLSNLVNFDELVRTLRNYSSAEVDTISDFMYKNMMEDTIVSVGEKFNNKDLVTNILNAMYLYYDPIDIYSLRDITKLASKEVEAVLKELQIKYIVFKQNGLYRLDELAVKFILIKKILPPRVQYLKLKREITEYKDGIRNQLESLKASRQSNYKLNIIISNWSPNSYSEEIAIAQAFHYFKSYKDKLETLSNSNKLDLCIIFEEIKENFDTLKYRGNHPYINFQQARVLKLLLRYKRIASTERLIENIVTAIKECYSEAYYIINSTHTYVLNTKSHAALLMQYGAFLLDAMESEESVKLLEEAVILYNSKFKEDKEEQINRFNAYYYLIVGEMALAIEDEENLKEYLYNIQENIKVFNELNQSMGSTKINDWNNKTVRVAFIDLFTSLNLDEQYQITREQEKNFYRNKRKWMTIALKKACFVDKLESLINERKKMRVF
ncbi:hypothetical protein COM04_20050 [Bacillus wiedmannii]|uniref:hypothetical protein n=1 Tax=Bacillus wiedmannii TaxID=1890302 RepID=UPI000BEC0FA8|nr:hypothetical protein [Bacillus wiedmannii]PEA76493.1 hypothetical protein CON92_19415 [Bacillus wiedmannii]PEG09151.1 hypothetical protein CON96_16520 [Bacillus wiedmannii]PEL40002.1 hypothetical protein CN607_18235 [Bacillus wiedmannii]PEP72706.1 hypothetical protein CN573_19700 [Bacillus wiedmannii]PGB93813.1 hypothetical protein COM04_20050 [Bacillus wiedmannii]